MKHIYLIRHGKPDFPGGQRMCLGRTDLPLSPEGFQQAAAAARLLAHLDLTVFSSPLTRAIQTAQALGRPVQVLEDLQELDAGAWDGLTFDQIRQRYPQLYAARADDKTIPLPGAESNEAGLLRFRAAVEAAASRASGDLAIVSHGGVLALFLKSITGTWKKPEYCEILRITWENGIFYGLENAENR